MSFLPNKTDLEYFLDSHLIKHSSIYYDRYNVKSKSGSNLNCFIFTHNKVTPKTMYNIQIFNHGGKRICDQMVEKGENDYNIELLKEFIKINGL